MGNRALAKRLGDSYYYYIYDGHGDVVMMLDENGNVVNSYSYDPWGVATEQTETVPNRIKYAGEYQDENGLIYLRARYYDPSVRRFIQEDRYWNSINMIYGDNSNGDSNTPNMAAIMQATNGYVYCLNNPIKFEDITGNTVILVIAGVALTATDILLIGVGLFLLGYLANKVFTAAFESAIALGKSISESISYAKGKAKAPSPPSKLLDGDKVKTPDTHSDEFTKKSDGSYEHKKTGWKFKKDTLHKDHWDVSPDGKNGNYINVNYDGTIR